MYVWKIDLSIDNVKKEIKKYMQIRELYCKCSLNQIVIRKPYYIFKTLPANYQPSLLLKYKKISESVTELTGKFGFPKIFYIVYYMLFFLTYAIFYLVSQNNNPLLFVYPMFMALASFFLIYILKKLSIVAFKKSCFDAKRFVDNFADGYQNEQL